MTKAFIIFPTICVFVLALTFLKLSGKIKTLWAIAWSVLIAGTFAGVIISYSDNAFSSLYYFNYSAVIITIPCLTYLINNNLPIVYGRQFWFRLLGLSLLATLLTAIIFGASMFFSLANNPMDNPAPKPEQQKEGA